MNSRDAGPDGPVKLAEGARRLREQSERAIIGLFVFQQVHNILADVPPENVLAMLDAVREYG